VRRLFDQVRAQVGERCASAHMHNTRGLGLANAFAAYEAGIRIFDSSMGGIGGCPFAPGASGNVVTEDLVFMFESMGVSTGVDLEKLFAAREVFAKGLPNEPTYGMVPTAGLPKGFVQADGLSAQ
jgi:hydroxymethylglutaryl-CoA lyase